MEEELEHESTGSDAETAEPSADVDVNTEQTPTDSQTQSQVDSSKVCLFSLFTDIHLFQPRPKALTRLPLSKVRRIIKKDEDIGQIKRDALLLITKFTVCASSLVLLKRSHTFPLGIIH